MPQRPGHPPRRPKKGSKLPWILVAVVAVIGAFFLLQDGGTGNDSGKLTFGDTIDLISSRVSAQGGTLEIESSGSVLNGMTLTVPEGAFEAGTDFTIRETEVETHAFGDLFTPITPLITVENGHDYAMVPMRLTIPIEIGDDAFAMGFYYDREALALGPVPVL